MDIYQLDKGLILTDSEEDSFEVKNKTIIVKSVWKWMLE